MHKAIWYSRYSGDVPCWLHSVQYHDHFPNACIAIDNGSGELSLRWVKMDEVRLLRRPAVSLEEGQ